MKIALPPFGRLPEPGARPTKRLLPLLLLSIVLTACVPTTRYRYVPLTPETFEAAQNGWKIPLVVHETALCFADAHTALVRDAELTGTGICGQAHPPVGDDDGNRCYGWDEVPGIGIPYESRSLQAFPMAAVLIGKCDPAKLAQ